MIHLVQTELSKTGEEIMTFREYCIAEGIEKGMEKGMIEVAKNALKQGFSIKAITQLTGLSIPDIEKLYRVEV